MRYVFLVVGVVFALFYLWGVLAIFADGGDFAAQFASAFGSFSGLCFVAYAILAVGGKIGVKFDTLKRVWRARQNSSAAAHDQHAQNSP